MNVFQEGGYWFTVERAVILCYNYTYKTVGHMILQVHSDGLSAIHGFDIEDIAVQTVDMEWIEQNNTQFVGSFYTSLIEGFVQTIIV